MSGVIQPVTLEKIAFCLKYFSSRTINPMPREEYLDNDAYSITKYDNILYLVQSHDISQIRMLKLSCDDIAPGETPGAGLCHHNWAAFLLMKASLTAGDAAKWHQSAVDRFIRANMQHIDARVVIPLLPPFN
jgi:hypothetical protein